MGRIEDQLTDVAKALNRVEMQVQEIHQRQQEVVIPKLDCVDQLKKDVDGIKTVWMVIKIAGGAAVAAVGVFVSLFRDGK